MHGILLPTFGMEWHTALMVYIVIGMGIFLFIMSKRLKLVPGKVQSMLELVLEMYVGLAEEAMGKDGKKYLSIGLSLGLFIFVANALSMIPGLLAPTENINTPAGLAITVFVITHIIGIKVHGVKYIKHFLGPVWWLIPFMLPLEIISHIARPLSLTLRLFGNMMGHEKIVGVLLFLMPAAYPMLAFSTILGIVVICVQSFIFSLLAMIYIGGALEEAH
jgi:F-type H+-transporting ATPase subunit a